MNKDKNKDIELWNRLLARDKEALSCMYKLYANVLFSYGVKLLKYRELVKDTVHDVFVKLWTNPNRPQHNDNIKLYLLVVFKNHLLNTMRSIKQYSDIETIYDLTDEGMFSDYGILQNENAQMEKQKLSLALSLISARQREAIYLRYTEGLDMADISVLMEMNIQSVQNLIQRAMTKMRSHFNG